MEHFEPSVLRGANEFSLRTADDVCDRSFGFRPVAI